MCTLLHWKWTLNKDSISKTKTCKGFVWAAILFSKTWTRFVVDLELFWWERFWRSKSYIFVGAPFWQDYSYPPVVKYRKTYIKWWTDEGYGNCSYGSVACGEDYLWNCKEDILFMLSLEKLSVNILSCNSSILYSVTCSFIMKMVTCLPKKLHHTDHFDLAK